MSARRRISSSTCISIRESPAPEQLLLRCSSLHPLGPGALPHTPYYWSISPPAVPSAPVPEDTESFSEAGRFYPVPTSRFRPEFRWEGGLSQILEIHHLHLHIPISGNDRTGAIHPIGQKDRVCVESFGKAKQPHHGMNTVHAQIHQGTVGKLRLEGIFDDSVPVIVIPGGVLTELEAGLTKFSQQGQSFFQDGYSGVNTERMASKKITPQRRAVSSIFSYSARLEATGFSHSTCLPASIIRMDWSQWQ